MPPMHSGTSSRVAWCPSMHIHAVQPSAVISCAALSLRGRPTRPEARSAARPPARHTSRSAQRRSATRTPQLAPLRHDLMRHAQLTSDLRRNLASPKQLSRSHAALFHRLHIAPRPTTSAYRNRSRRFPVKSWAHAPSLSHKPMAPVIPRPQSVSRVSFRNRRAPFEVPRRMRRQ
jgi:hypothetical protein